MSAPTPQLWTDADTERARALYFDQGISAADIAPLIGRTRRGVISRMNRLFGLLDDDDRRLRLGRMGQPKRRRVAPQPKAKPMLVSVPAPASNPVPLLQLIRHGCRFPVGYAGQHLFCNAPCEIDASYCAEHAARCFNPRPLSRLKAGMARPDA